MERAVIHSRNNVIEQLRKDVLSMQGIRRSSDEQATNTGLGILEKAFPGGVFPLGAVHEFTSPAIEHVASTNGFIAALISKLMNSGGVCLWVSTKPTVFPPALRLFGMDPDKVIFVDPFRTKEALWVIEEALKCEALTAVVGELTHLDFTASRRLQLAVEQSRVTGFIHRLDAQKDHTVACLTRWRVSPLTCEESALPGIGLPRWHVELSKVRNGKPGAWDIEWSGSGFDHVDIGMRKPSIRSLIADRKTG